MTKCNKKIHLWNIRKVFTQTLELIGDHFSYSLPFLLKAENQRKPSNSVQDAQDTYFLIIKIHFKLNYSLLVHYIISLNKPVGIKKHDSSEGKAQAIFESTTDVLLR